MRILLSSALLTSLILSACASRERTQNHIPGDASVYNDPDGYAVLSGLLTGASAEAHAGTIRINMLTHVESVSGNRSLEGCVKVPDEFREAAGDYERKVSKPYLLGKRFKIAASYDLVGESRIVGSNRKPPAASEQATSQKISAGVFYLSPVGFDASHTHAIAYENYICGNLCGGGGFHLLVKNGNHWEEGANGGCWWNY